ncbi:hypothetical protein ACJJI5_12315 [Microbulbifer sp. EKSA008]|uniref:hypothetical protein n=1 Tax=Microbulbifer sp. EKSA008 TaxID=3243367 RepID=UPI004042B782
MSAARKSVDPSRVARKTVRDIEKVLASVRHGNRSHLNDRQKMQFLLNSLDALDVNLRDMGKKAEALQKHFARTRRDVAAVDHGVRSHMDDHYRTQYVAASINLLQNQIRNALKELGEIRSNAGGSHE